MPRALGTGGQAKELTATEIARISQHLLEHSNASRNLAIFQLGLGSGLRIGEICSLRLGDVYNGRQILDEIRLGWERCKSGRSRTVALSLHARASLQYYLQYRLLFGTDPRLPLFLCEGSQRPLLTNSAMKMLKHAFEAVGIPQASSHSLRRTHANALRRNGVDLKVIQSQLGHSSLAVTEKYLSVDPAEQRSAVAGLEF